MRRLSLNRSVPATKSGQNILKNRCRTTIAERMVETLAELPFIGDQVGLLKPRLGRPQRQSVRRSAHTLPLSQCGKGHAAAVDECRVEPVRPDQQLD